MTKSILLRGAVLFFATLSPIAASAQFQQPTDEELKMTADPKAPGAAAVYLDYREVTNDPQHFLSVYARIKVLTEKGKELATVELPYLRGETKVTEIQGRTIHPDGTIVPLAVKPEDLMIVKTGDRQLQRRVFTLPSVEVGSILEYRFDVNYDDGIVSSPQWKIQQKYLVHKAHYQFTPQRQFMPTGTAYTPATTFELEDSRGRRLYKLLCWQLLPTGVNVQSSVNGSFSVDVADVPAIPDEEHMPPVESFLYRVGFFYSYAQTSTEFWTTEIKLWSKDVDKFAEPSSKIHDAVNGLIASTDSDLDKAKKMYDAVQALDNTDYSRAKSASELKELKIKATKNATDTWTQKSGSSEDIAMLYLSMLRAAGLTAYAMKVVNREQNIFDQSNMNLDQLDSTLVDLSTGGKDVVLDPGEKMCPFQTVSWRHSYASGIAESAEGGRFITTPMQQYKDNVTQRLGDVYIDAQGGVTGRINIVMNGQDALHWRQRALKEDDTELKKEFDREELEGNVPDGVEAHVDHFLSINDPYIDLMAAVTIKGSLGTATGKRMILPGFFFETRGHVPFVNEDKRLIPVDMHYGRRVTDEITYHFPDGATIEGAPQDASIPWPSHAALISKSVAQPGEITIRQTLLVGFTVAKPDEYQDLRAFYQKVAGADQEQLVLTMPPAPVPSGKGTAPAGGGN
jgi:transglutaminase-like putative cysteine protease